MSATSSNILPKVSIIVPVYNAERYLSNCIHSILSQTYDNFELIIVDDGSTDNSKIIYTSISDERLHIIHQNNLGASAARNAGLKKATGEYVTFVDADDTISPKMISTMINTIASSHTDIVICSLKREAVSQPEYTLFEAVSYNQCWETCGKLIKRSTIHQSFNQKIAIGEDLLFYYENYKTNQNFIFIDDNLYHYNLHPGSMMNNKKTTIRDVSCLDVILRIIDDISLSENLHAFYQAYYIQVYYRIFARSSKLQQMKLAKKKYSKYIDVFYKTAKEHHYLNFQLFIKHRLTWIYNITERLQRK